MRAHYLEVGREVAQRRPAGCLGTSSRRSRYCRSAAGARSPARPCVLALKITPDVYALHIAGDEHAVLDLEDTWQRRVRQPSMEAGVAAPRLIVIFSPFRQLYQPLMDVVADLQRAHPGRDIAVIVPELVGDEVVPLSPA